MDAEIETLVSALEEQAMGLTRLKDMVHAARALRRAQHAYNCNDSGVNNELLRQAEVAVLTAARAFAALEPMDLTAYRG